MCGSPFASSQPQGKGFSITKFLLSITMEVLFLQSFRKESSDIAKHGKAEKWRYIVSQSVLSELSDLDNNLMSNKNSALVSLTALKVIVIQAIGNELKGSLSPVWKNNGTVEKFWLSWCALLQDTGLCRSLLCIDMMGSEALQVSSARI